MKKRNMAKWYLPVLAVWAVLLVVVAVVQGFDTRAKYTMTKDDDVEAVAQAFYFESDLLDGGTYELPAGTDTVTFTLRNHADDLRTAECDIAYQIYLDGKEVAGKAGSLAGNAVKDVTIKLEELTAGTHTVKAAAVSPYAAELSATFVIPEKDLNVYYTVTDSANSPVVTVTVKTVDYAGNVTIGWNGSVYPDNTDPKMANAANSVTVKFEKNAEYTFLFFKQTPSAYITSNSGVFSVEK